MRHYVYRVDSKDQWAPTLRAALRLGKRQDLEKAERLYQALYDVRAARSSAISRDELLAVCGDESSLRRMGLLFGNEWVANLRSLPPGAGAEISEDVLEWPTLRDYLLRSILRQGNKRAPDAGRSQPKARVALSRVSIANFRSIQRAELPDFGPLTILAGPNNAGKSNLLRALRFASQVAAAGISQASEQEGGSRSVFRQQMSRDARLEIELGLKIGSSDATDLAGRYRIELSRVPRQPIIEELLERQGVELVRQTGESATIRDDTDKRDDLYLARGETALSALRDLHRYRKAIGIREGLASWAFFNFEAGTIRRGRGFSFLPHRHRFPLAPDGTNLPAALSELGRDDPDALRAIASAFQDFVPEVSDLHVAYQLSGDPVIALQEEGLTDPLSLVDMSDGMVRLLAIAYIALHPDPPPLVCIEEPENALYPRLVEVALDLLRTLARRSQVIVTTHSVTLLNLLNPEEVVFVQRLKDTTELSRLSTRADVVSFLETFRVGEQLRMGALERET